MRFMCHFVIVATLLQAATVAHSADPADADGIVQKVVGASAKAILFTAHPTATFKAIGIAEISRTNSEFVVTTRIRYICALTSSECILDVKTTFSDSYAITNIEWGDDTGIIPPGLAAKAAVTLVALALENSDKFEQERLKRIQRATTLANLNNNRQLFAVNCWVGVSILDTEDATGKKTQKLLLITFDPQGADRLWLFTENLDEKTFRAFDTKYELLALPDNENIIALRCFIHHAYISGKIDKRKPWEVVKWTTLEQKDGFMPFAALFLIKIKDGQFLFAHDKKFKQETMKLEFLQSYYITEDDKKLEDKAPNRAAASLLKISAPQNIGGWEILGTGELLPANNWHTDITFKYLNTHRPPGYVPVFDKPYLPMPEKQR